VKTRAARHAYRVPQPRLHLIAAITHPGAQPGHQVRIVFGDTPLAAPLPQPGPADLTLIWELPVLAVQHTPTEPPRIVHRSRYQVLTACLTRLHQAAMRVHHRAAELRHANERHAELLLERLELRAWQRLPRPVKLAGQQRGHALAAAYAEGGTETMGDLVTQVRALILAEALAGPALVNGTYHATGGAR